MASAQNLLGFCFFACAPQAPFSCVSPCFYLFFLLLMGSKSNVSAFFRLQFRNGLSTKPAGALLFRMRSPSTFFLGFGQGFALFLLIFSGFQKQRFGIFQAAVSQWLGHKTCWGSAFSHALPKHLFLGFCLVFSGFRFGIFWLRFRKQRFGIFPAAVSQWLGHKTCWGSAFSHALPKHLFLGFCLVFIYFYLFLVGSKSNVSALGMISLFFCKRVGIFLAVLSHGLGTISLFLLVGSKNNVSAFFRLQFRNGLGTKLAGALLFSMRSPSTFFLVLPCFCLFLVGSKSNVSAFIGLQFRNGLGIKPAGALLFRMRTPSTFFLGFALFLVGSKSNVSAFFWLRFRMAWARFLCF